MILHPILVKKEEFINKIETTRTLWENTHDTLRFVSWGWTPWAWSVMHPRLQKADPECSEKSLQGMMAREEWKGARRILTTTVLHGHSEYMEPEVQYTGYGSLGKSLECSGTQLHHLHNGDNLTHLIRNETKACKVFSIMPDTLFIKS